MAPTYDTTAYSPDWTPSYYYMLYYMKKQWVKRELNGYFISAVNDLFHLKSINVTNVIQKA